MWERLAKLDSELRTLTRSKKNLKKCQKLL